MIARISKFVLAVLVVVFMVVVYLSGATPSTPLTEVEDALLQTSSIQDVAMSNSQQTARCLGLYPEDYKELYYWKSTDGMNVSEVAIAEAKDGDQAATIKAAFEQRLSDQKTAFNGYAPEQEAKLESAYLKVRGNYVFYAVGSSEQLSEWTGVLDGIQ